MTKCRLEEESRAFQNKIQSLFELREAAREARERQQNEIKKMMFEDVSRCSCYCRD